MTKRTSRNLNYFSRREFLALAGTGLAGVAVSSIPASALEESGLTITAKSGRTYRIPKPELRYYFGKNEYWYTNSTDYASYKIEPGKICLVQGWLRLNCPIERISVISRIDSASLEKEGGWPRKKYPSLSGLPFELNTNDAFEVTFRDGAKIIANLEGGISGTAKVGSLAGAFSAEISKIERITVTGDGSAEFRLISGVVQSGVTRVKSIDQSGFDRYKFHIAGARGRYDDAEGVQVVIDSASETGGVMLTLVPRAFAGRTLTLARKAAFAKDSNSTAKADPYLEKLEKGDTSARESKSFQIAGLVSDPLDCEIAWLRSDAETYRNGLAELEASCTVSGIEATLTVEANQIQELALSADKGILAIKTLRLGNGVNSVEFTNLHDVTFWYQNAASLYNDASEKESFSFKIGELVTEVKLADIKTLSSTDAGMRTLVLKNGESYTGAIQIEDGKPLAIVGKIAGGYGGFPAEGCFVLTDIAAIQAGGPASASLPK